MFKREIKKTDKFEELIPYIVDDRELKRSYIVRKLKNILLIDKSKPISKRHESNTPKNAKVFYF